LVFAVVLGDTHMDMLLWVYKRY